MKSMKCLRSKLGLVLALLYGGSAAFVAVSERLENTSGNFINLNGLMTFAVTLPVSYVFDRIAALFGAAGPGRLAFFERPYSTGTITVIILMIALNAAFVYAVGALIGFLFRKMFRRTERIH